MWIDVDDEELFPPASSLTYLQFESPEAFNQALTFVWTHLSLYCDVHRDTQRVVVRKSDVPQFRAAGLAFKQVDLPEPQTLSAEDEARLQQEAVQRALQLGLQRLGWKS
jgi:hypothetical protein